MNTESTSESSSTFEAIENYPGIVEPRLCDQVDILPREVEGCHLGVALVNGGSGCYKRDQCDVSRAEGRDQSWRRTCRFGSILFTNGVWVEKYRSKTMMGQ